MLDSVKEIDSLTEILKDKIAILKQGFEKFKIKSASKKLPTRVRDRKKVKFSRELPINKDMVFVQGGKYTPSFFNEEREVGNLEVCKYQTTQDMWEELMDYNNSKTKGSRLPVTNVSWWEALEYCNKLSEKYGLQPMYIVEDIDGIKKLKIQQLDGEISYPDIADFRKTEGFRLPTELEWEWFARGGEIAIQDGTFDTLYAGSDNVDEVAWYKENSGEKIHNVGTKKPNELGLYDCSGNVLEYCYDSSTKGYLSEDKPYIYDESEESSIARGGCIYCDSKELLAIKFRYSLNKNDKYGSFRIVRTVK